MVQIFLLQFLKVLPYQEVERVKQKAYLEKPDKDDPDTLFLSADIVLRLKRRWSDFWYENREGSHYRTLCTAI